MTRVNHVICLARFASQILFKSHFGQIIVDFHLRFHRI